MPLNAVSRRVLFVLVCLCLAGCDTVSGTGRRQVNLYQPSDDATIGAQAWEEVLSDPKVVRTGPKAERVRRVGDRIVEAATQRRVRAPSVPRHCGPHEGVPVIACRARGGEPGENRAR